MAPLLLSPLGGPFSEVLLYLCYGSAAIIKKLPFSRGDRRQNPMSEVDPALKG